MPAWERVRGVQASAMESFRGGMFVEQFEQGDTRAACEGHSESESEVVEQSSSVPLVGEKELGDDSMELADEKS